MVEARGKEREEEEDEDLALIRLMLSVDSCKREDLNFLCMSQILCSSVIIFSRRERCWFILAPRKKLLHCPAPHFWHLEEVEILVCCLELIRFVDPNVANYMVLIMILDTY